MAPSSLARFDAAIAGLSELNGYQLLRRGIIRNQARARAFDDDPALWFFREATPDEQSAIFALALKCAISSAARTVR